VREAPWCAPAREIDSATLPDGVEAATTVAARSRGDRMPPRERTEKQVDEGRSESAPRGEVTAERYEAGRRCVRDCLGDSLCMTCKHEWYGTNKCDAFPGGIPLGIVCGELDHRGPIEGDGGVRYEEAELTGESLCLTCKHREPGRGRCAAFPGGIPMEIYAGEWDHRKEIPGDHGLRYERRA
jgi:hypothetical protein